MSLKSIGIDFGKLFGPRDLPKCNDRGVRKGDRCACPKDGHATTKGRGDCKR